MNTLVEPPPKRGMGCFGKGCLILIVLAILLVVVGVGGTYWGLRHVYLSDKPARSLRLLRPLKPARPRLVKQAWPHRAKKAPRFANAWIR